MISRSQKKKNKKSKKQKKGDSAANDKSNAKPDLAEAKKPHDTDDPQPDSEPTEGSENSKVGLLAKSLKYLMTIAILSVPALLVAGVLSNRLENKITGSISAKLDDFRRENARAASAQERINKEKLTAIQKEKAELLDKIEKLTSEINKFQGNDTIDVMTAEISDLKRQL